MLTVQKKLGRKKIIQKNLDRSLELEGVSFPKYHSCM
jgi:hypothetical protein